MRLNILVSVLISFFCLLFIAFIEDRKEILSVGRKKSKVMSIDELHRHFVSETKTVDDREGVNLLHKITKAINMIMICFVFLSLSLIHRETYGRIS